MSENGQPADAAIPPSASRRILDNYMWTWEHGDNRVVLHVTPALSINGQIVRDGEPIALVFTGESWDTFMAEVARGGHSSPVAIAKKLPR